MKTPDIPVDYQRYTVPACDTAPQLTRQGHMAIPALSKESVGATQMSAITVVVPPLEMGHTHVHPLHESIIFILGGHAVTFMGHEMQPTFQRTGDFLFIPKGVPHVPANLSAHEDFVAITIRANADTIEPLELHAELDVVARGLIGQLREQYNAGTLPTGWPPAELGGEPFRLPEGSTVNGISAHS